MKLVGSALAVVLFAAVLTFVRPASPADALDEMTGEERELARAVLGERTWNGVDAGDPTPMILDGPLTGQAQLQASRMAAEGTGRIWHSGHGELLWWVLHGWCGGVSENVAMAGSVGAAHVALMRSPDHLHNILNPDWRGMGIAVRRDAAGRVYVAEFFGAF